MRKIAIEEHFTTQACQDALRSREGFPHIGIRFIESVKVPESDHAKICHQNAERLLAP